MATKKKTTAKKRTAKKATSAKSSAPKKKVAPKKKAKVVAPKKKAKAVAPKKKAKAVAPKKKAKAVAPKKKATAAPKKVAVAAPAKKPERPTFPAVLEELVSWVNEGRAGNLDFEMYGSFNEQYKPSDWTRNPASDDELFTFGMDGSGGQVAIWRRDAAPLEELPVVFLGSEGEVKPLATSLPSFLHLVASGFGPAEIAFATIEDPTPNESMLEWVQSTYPNRAFSDPQSILDDAAEALAGFEAHLMATTKS